MNLCTGSWCKWEERLLKCLCQTREERKSSQARTEDAEEGGQWISHEWP